MTDVIQPLLSIKAVARQLDVSEKTVRRWIERGELPAYKLGGRMRVSPKDLDIFLKLRRSS